MMNSKVEMLKLQGMGKWEGKPHLLRKDVVIPLNLKEPRLINPFKLGCDPEFCFVDSGRDRLVNASNFGLGLNTAYGRDGSSIPCELRAAPSRFAVGVVASLLEALRLLAVDKKDSTLNLWQAEPVVYGHPCGGHLHLGVRGQVDRDCELGVLDRTSKLMMGAGLFSKESYNDRIAYGYGRLGDWRSQSHGWEYRVLPTWLKSPAIAHLTLTLSKLAVRDWRLWGVVDLPADESGGRERIGNILSAYRYLDDDAALALKGLKWTLDTKYGDMKLSWGIKPTGKEELPNRYKAPREIEPSTDTLVEVAKAISEQVPLPFHIPSFANKEPTGAPTGYKWLNLYMIDGDTSSYCIPLCAVRGWNFRVESNRFINRIVVPMFVLAAMTLEQIENIRLVGHVTGYLVYPGLTPTFSFPSNFIEGYLSPNSKWREALFGRAFGLLPLCEENAATTPNRLWWNKRLRSTKAIQSL